MEEVGAGCTKFSKGDRVAWLYGGNLKSGQGSWQQYTSLHEDLLVGAVACDQHSIMQATCR